MREAPTCSRHHICHHICLHVNHCYASFVPPCSGPDRSSWTCRHLLTSSAVIAHNLELVPANDIRTEVCRTRLPNSSITISAPNGSRITAVVVWYLLEGTTGPVNITAGGAHVTHHTCSGQTANKLSSYRALHSTLTPELVPMATLVSYPRPVENATITIEQPDVQVVSVSAADTSGGVAQGLTAGMVYCALGHFRQPVNI